MTCKHAIIFREVVVEVRGSAVSSAIQIFLSFLFGTLKFVSVNPNKTTLHIINIFAASNHKYTSYIKSGRRPMMTAVLFRCQNYVHRQKLVFFINSLRHRE